MGWPERGALAVLLIAGIAHADTPNYGRVETFQPGKKYNCVPTADHKAWDCSESGKAAAARAERKGETAPPPEPPSPAAAAPAPKAGELPAYLTNSAAGRRERAAAAAPPAPKSAEMPTPAPAPPAAAAPARPAATVAAPVSAAPATRSSPAAIPAQISTPAAASAPAAAAPDSATPPTESAPARAEIKPPAAMASTAAATAGNREFLALPASSYIVEIAHSANHADIAALHADLHLPLGELYELHLTRDGGDWWLLVWGHFGDIESARAARSDLPAAAAVNAGWPRRVAPLQAEARKTEEQ